MSFLARNKLLLAASAVAFAMLVTLGTWQVRRLQWKEDLIARIEARIAAQPARLGEIERAQAGGEDIDYRPVQVTGAFVHGGERHFLATWKGQSGFYIHTPLHLPDGRYLFINRGFVPYDRKDPATRQEGQIADETHIEGLARTAPAEKPSFIVPDNDPARNVFYWKDLDAMAASAGLPSQGEVLPFYVDAGPQENPGGLPVGGVTRIDFPNSHLQYALTWYGLAAALAGVVGYMLLRGGRRD